MIAIIGTSDQPCWLAESCKILLLLLLVTMCVSLFGLTYNPICPVQLYHEILLNHVISLVGWQKHVKFFFFFFR